MGILTGCSTGTATTTVHQTVAVTPLISITTLRTPPPAPVPATPTGVDPRAVADYFAEIAFGSEFGNSDHRIHKWTHNPRITVHGSPTAADSATLARVISDLNDIIGPIDLELVPAGGDIDVYFVPEHEFASIADDYVPGNIGLFSTWWNGRGEMTRGRVLISTTIRGQSLRDHTIREEITQALGLAQDSYTYPDSIFHQEITTATEFSAIDRGVIEMLYRPEVVPGMNRDQAFTALDIV
ncbi:hypothetical protein CYL16_12240 [Mycobacterium sp. EPG1]|nr:hypothetical protein CYL16_12240 [Mycobacterium sp. EPG1]